MSHDYDDYYEPEYDPEDQPRDHAIDKAKVDIKNELFLEGADAVFYQRQIEVRYEDKYFHWIVAKALKELTEEKFLSSESQTLIGNSNIRFYWHPKNRYWKRRAAAIKKIVAEFSQSRITRAIGQQGEMMFDSALNRFGFNFVARNARSHNDEVWKKSKHDLDRIVTSDGIDYGIEIKNTLSYIERSEFLIKLEMCDYLGLRPLFIMRMAPRSYMNEIYRAGGFGLIFEQQLYPYGMDDLAEKVKKELGLRVQCVRDVQDGHLQRLKKWHLGLVAKRAKR